MAFVAACTPWLLSGGSATRSADGGIKQKGMCCASSNSTAGRIFELETRSGCWDERCFFHPIVVKEPFQPWGWRMYYYGRGGDSWHSGVSPAVISSGRIGMASSKDGITWTRVQGPLSQGAVVDPREGCPSAFDCVHVGCSDVVFHEGMWWMYYFGGNLEATNLPGGRTVTGMRLRTGLARSVDGIHSFDKLREDQPILDVGSAGEWDELMAAWARVIPATLSKKQNNSPKWLMTYCGMNISSTPPFSIGVAVSEDGFKWSKLGKAIQSGVLGSWDDAGVSRRHVIFFNGQYIMFYEGVNKHGTHGIGLALSNDGVTWVKDTQEPGKDPGGPIFTASSSPEAWDSGGVAAPHVEKMTDNSLRLYYVGFDSSKKVSAIGLAVSDGDNFRIWKRIEPLDLNVAHSRSVSP